MWITVFYPLPESSNFVPSILIMDRSGREGIKVWTPLLFSLILISGMVLGFYLHDSLRAKRDIGETIERNDRLEQIIDLIDEKYVDTVNSDDLYKNAVTGILKSLDPHTVYIPAEELQTLNDDLEGGFSGIGVEFSIVRDTIEVTSVIDKGPASQVGIQVGDQLIKVGDSLVAGINISTERLIHLLKGKQNSVVNVTIRHAFSPALHEVAITRDIIPIHSVEAATMLDKHTAFIKIARFNANTHKEFINAFKTLKDLGATQLILDLRDNPGGYVDQAASVADELLDDKKLILYTKGLHTPRQDYRANLNGIFESGKLTVLIDEGTASASEILAGALQDWDRGVLLGRRSFGKGLVQEPYELPDGSELRLTIARYYTPSGRSIQRSFAKGRDAYDADIQQRLQSGELTGNAYHNTNDTTPYYTAGHRTVFGGGGINPDVYVPYDTSRFSNAFVHVVSDALLNNAIWDYFIHNMHRLKYRGAADFDQSFDEEDIIVEKYLASLPPQKRLEVKKQLKNSSYEEFLNNHIRAQLARFLFHNDGYYYITSHEDEVIQKALTIINSGAYGQILSGQ